VSWGEGEQLDESRRLPPPPRPVRDGPTPDAHAELAEQLDPKIGHQTLPKAVLLDDRPPVDGRRPFEVRLGSERESDRGDEREEKLSATAFAALVEGRWREARSDFERVQAHGETAEECFGLGVSLRWLGENHARVDRCSRAYALVRQSGDGASAAQCAEWLAITYKANFGQPRGRQCLDRGAERLLEPFPPWPLHGWLSVARAYRMAELNGDEVVAERAVDEMRLLTIGEIVMVAEAIHPRYRALVLLAGTGGLADCESVSSERCAAAASPCAAARSR